VGRAVRPGAAGRRVEPWRSGNPAAPCGCGGTRRREVEVGEPGGASCRWGAPGGGSALRRRWAGRAGAGVPRGVVGRGCAYAGRSRG
jgi:hypothetical protein